MKEKFEEPFSQEKSSAERSAEWFDNARTLIPLLKEHGYTPGGWSVEQPQVLDSIQKEISVDAISEKDLDELNNTEFRLTDDGYEDEMLKDYGIVDNPAIVQKYLNRIDEKEKALLGKICNLQDASLRNDKRFNSIYLSFPLTFEFTNDDLKIPEINYGWMRDVDVYEVRDTSSNPGDSDEFSWEEVEKEIDDAEKNGWTTIYETRGRRDIILEHPSGERRIFIRGKSKSKRRNNNGV